MHADSHCIVHYVDWDDSDYREKDSQTKNDNEPSIIIQKQESDDDEFDHGNEFAGNQDELFPDIEDDLPPIEDLIVEDIPNPIEAIGDR
eukprot:UN20381